MMKKRLKHEILAVDDHVSMRRLYRSYLSGDFHIDLAANAKTALEMATETDYDLYIIDLMMPGMNGIQLIRKLKGIRSEIACIVVSQTDEIDMAIDAFREHALDFLRKPVSKKMLKHTVNRVLKNKTDQMKLLHLQNDSGRSFQCPEPVYGHSEEMKLFWKRVRKIASSGISPSVLITGESGSGKEIVARQLHRWSSRGHGPFLAVNCSVLRGDLVVSELMGIEKGVATGVNKQPGKFRLADGGTLFLDEISELPKSVQPLILRALQERVIRPVGGNREYPIDTMVLTATNRDLKRMIATGEFREDLYYRLSVVNVDVPPLRSHREDIPILLDHLYRRHGGRGELNFSNTELESWQQYHWPGNIRELENVLINRIIMDQPIDPSSMDFSEVSTDDSVKDWLKARSFRDVRDYMFKYALERTDGNIRQASKLLQVTPSTVWHFLKTRDEKTKRKTSTTRNEPIR